MKILTLILLALLLVCNLHAQNTFPTTGNVLIGTTTDNGADKLHVNGNINTSGIHINATGGRQAILTLGNAHDGYFYSTIATYSQYKTNGYTWTIGQDYQGNILNAGLGSLFFTVGSGAKVIHFNNYGTGTFGGSVNASGSMSVGNNSGNATNRINLAGNDASHYIYSSGTSGNNLI